MVLAVTNPPSPRQVPNVRITALASHPVMYQSQLYRLVAANPLVELTVIFASNAGVRPYRDTGFGGHIIEWDQDLLAGYTHSFLGRAKRNRVDRFFDLADWDVVHHITRDRCDVLWVHSYSFLTLWLAIVAAKARGIPVMIREEQTLLHRRPWWKEGFRALILRTLFKGVSGLAIGSNNRAFFQHYGVPEHRIHLVPYTTDNEDWQRQARDLAQTRDSIRTLLGIPAGSPAILFVGKLLPKKQPGLLLAAFEKVRKVLPCSLVLVGLGELEQELHRIVAQNTIPDVIFVGFQNRSEISRAFAAADVFVLPSAKNETWGMVVNEAMNFGLPVIVSDRVGCAPDLVRSGANGYVFDHRSTQELADAIAKLVSDPGLRQRFGRRSLEIITLWSPRSAADGLVAAALASIVGTPSADRN